MATSEQVTVSVGDVMMLKSEGDGDAEDPSKTQVILQLQPISTGYVQRPWGVGGVHSVVCLVF